MLDINKTLKKTNKITENLTQRLYSYIGMDITILEVDFMNKKFLVEKRFQNNVVGKDELEEAIKNFDSEEKIKKHGTKKQDIKTEL